MVVVGTFRPRAGAGWESDPLSGAGFYPAYSDGLASAPTYGPFVVAGVLVLRVRLVGQGAARDRPPDPRAGRGVLPAGRRGIARRRVRPPVVAGRRPGTHHPAGLRPPADARAGSAPSRRAPAPPCWWCCSSGRRCQSRPPCWPGGWSPRSGRTSGTSCSRSGLGRRQQLAAAGVEALLLSSVACRDRRARGGLGALAPDPPARPRSGRAPAGADASRGSWCSRCWLPRSCSPWRSSRPPWARAPPATSRRDEVRWSDSGSDLLLLAAAVVGVVAAASAAGNGRQPRRRHADAGAGALPRGPDRGGGAPRAACCSREPRAPGSARAAWSCRSPLSRPLDARTAVRRWCWSPPPSRRRSSGSPCTRPGTARSTTRRRCAWAPTSSLALPAPAGLADAAQVDAAMPGQPSGTGRLGGHPPPARARALRRRGGLPPVLVAVDTRQAGALLRGRIDPGRGWADIGADLAPDERRGRPDPARRRRRDRAPRAQPGGSERSR